MKLRYRSTEWVEWSVIINSLKPNFRYELDNGETFRGQTYAVQGSIYFLFSAENEIYWTSIRSNEYEENENFTKIVREGKPNLVELEFVFHSVFVSFRVCLCVCVFSGS